MENTSPKSKRLPRLPLNLPEKNKPQCSDESCSKDRISTQAVRVKLPVRSTTKGQGFLRMVRVNARKH